MMEKERLPDLSGLSSHIARTATQMEQAADLMTRRVDRMVRAAGRGNWTAVGRLGRRLAKTARSEGYRGISALAKRVSDEAAKGKNDVAIKRNMIRLIGAQGRMPRRAVR